MKRNLLSFIAAISGIFAIADGKISSPTKSAFCEKVYDLDASLLSYDKRHSDSYHWMKYRYLWEKVYPKYVNPWMFKQAILCYHNHYRKFHGAPPVKLNYALTQKAQKWADSMARGMFFGHSAPSGNIGENIYRGHFVTAGEVVNAFYDEIGHFNFKHPFFSPKTGHFSQFLWKGTKEIGVGIASPKKDPNNYYVVINYTPAGNILDPKIYKKNVLPCSPFQLCHGSLL